MRQIDRDVDPDVVAAHIASRERYAAKTATWGNPKRCETNVCDQDGSCVYCDADQGEACKPVAPPPDPRVAKGLPDPAA